MNGLPFAHTVLPWEDPVLLASLKAVGPQLTSALGGPLTIRLLNSKGEKKAEIRIDSTEVMAKRR